MFKIFKNFKKLFIFKSTEQQGNILLINVGHPINPRFTVTKFAFSV